MNLIFESSRPGRSAQYLPVCDVPDYNLSDTSLREKPPRLPEAAECDLVRHYAALAGNTFGLCNGFYPLGSCTMKYNPKANEEFASLPGFTEIHPLQPAHTVQGCLTVLQMAEASLCSITGMDRMTFQPAAGAHGEFTGLLLIKAYHRARGDLKRTKIIVPDSAHGTNPASAAMAGMTVINVPSGADGCVDVEKLRAVVGEDTAGLMLTNPNTVGLFDKNILQITEIVHQAGGLCYYDGANLNAVMGIVRPGDIGFDCIHLNLHKTFATPHGGGGPGAGPVGCKDFLAAYLPIPLQNQDGNDFETQKAETMGRVKSFYGNFLVVVKALGYILHLGREGIVEAAENAVLNANYLMQALRGKYDLAFDEPCMHEFVISCEKLKKETGVSAMDIAKSLLDEGMHPPTMYFPLNVAEALMVEPTETESVETLDAAAQAFIRVLDRAHQAPETLHSAPHRAVIGRPDEVTAARSPKLRYHFPDLA